MAASSPTRPFSFDDLVGAGEQCSRNGQSDRLGGLQIDNELKLGRLLDGQVGRRLATKDAADILRSTSPKVVDSGAVAQQRAGVCHSLELTHEREPLLD